MGGNKLKFHGLNLLMFCKDISYERLDKMQSVQPVVCLKLILSTYTLNFLADKQQLPQKPTTHFGHGLERPSRNFVIKDTFYRYGKLDLYTDSYQEKLSMMCSRIKNQELFLFDLANVTLDNLLLLTALMEIQMKEFIITWSSLMTQLETRKHSLISLVNNIRSVSCYKLVQKTKMV